MPKVLLIDDDRHLLSLLTTILVKHQFEVIAAEDGVSGLRQARDGQPDLIILDIIMPGVNGFEVAERLRADPACAHIPIMALTANAIHHWRKKAAELGVDDFVGKPFRIDDLVARARALTMLRGGATNGSVAK
jgi:DNA-binding response OmpR family regulator